MKEDKIMATVLGTTIKNGKIATSFGVFNFVEGKADIPDDAAEKLVSLPGFQYEGAQNAPKPEEKPAPEEEVKQEDSDTQESEIEQPEAQQEEKSEAKFDEKELNTKNVAQLRKIAKDNGIDIGDASKKDEIIAILMA